MVDALLHFYQILDRFKHHILLSAFGYSSVCKHRPTCSQFARQAVVEHGTICGLLRASYRLLTCW